MLKTFKMYRHEDVSGVSGCGVVAEGCLICDTGEIIIRWIGSHSSINIYHSLDDALFIHGHQNRTKIIFDEE
jgi:hypothetical protein